jgi:hypothetical protein
VSPFEVVELMIAAYILGEALGWFAVRAVHARVRRDRP